MENSDNQISKDNFDIYMDQISAKQDYSEVDVIELIRKAQNGDADARNKAIECNLKLVLSIANYFRGRGIEFEDLVQEGNIGLMLCIDKFDTTSGNKFSTYAVPYIKGYIQRALSNKSSVIRLSVHMYDKIVRCRTHEAMLANKLNRRPTTEELAESLKTTPEDIEKIFQYGAAVYSLDHLLGPDNSKKEAPEDKSATKKDFIPSEEPTPEEILIKEDLKNKVMELIEKANLKPREEMVLKLRFGLYDNEIHTLEEIGKIYHVSREWIRQVEGRALLKLRKCKNFDFLDSYVSEEARKNVVLTRKKKINK